MKKFRPMGNPGTREDWKYIITSPLRETTCNEFNKRGNDNRILRLTDRILLHNVDISSGIINN